MRNIDGINPTTRLPEESKKPFKEPENFSTHFFKQEKTKKSLSRHISKLIVKKRIKFNKKNFVLIILIIIFMFGVRVAYTRSQQKALNIKKELSVKITVIEGTVSDIQKQIGTGEINKAIDNLTILKGNIVDLKMIAQRWGQDIKYFQTIGGSSELTKQEKLLDTAYESIVLIESLPEELKKLEETSYLGQDGDIADVKGFRLQLAKIVEKLDSFASHSQTNLIGISYAQNLMPKIGRLLDQLSFAKKAVNEDLMWLSGEDGKDKNLLIIFQNNRELRGGSGGSFGSFGIGRIRDGKIRKIDFGANIYKLDKAFAQKEHVAPPSELKTFGDDWTLKQSGFAVDGQEALDKIRWFYEKETGEKVDGVITIDTDAFTSLFQVIGPIDMPAYGKILNANNFVDETMQEVQNDYFDREGGKTENEPKKIIGDMMPVFIGKLFNAFHDKQKSFEIIQSVKKSVAEKHILFNFAKEDLQREVAGLNIAGTVKKTVGDYLYINNSNLAGAKSNQNMVENVVLDSEISKEGELVNNLSIERIHTGQSKAPDGLDRNYMRVLIPEGSKIQSFSPVKGNFQRYYDQGFKDGQPYWVDKEAGRTTINFWMSTEPQHNTMAKMSYKPNYKLELKNDFVYTINFQRQPGAPADNIELKLTYPKGYTPVNVDNFSQLGHTLILKLKVDTDKEIKIKFEKNLVSNS